MEWNLLEDLSEAQRSALVSRCQRRRYRRRQALFHHGDPSDGMHLVVSGRVVVRISAPSGEEASLTVAGPGQVVGEQSLLVEGERRSASAVALEPVETMFLSKHAFVAWRAADAHVDAVMLRVMRARVLRLTDQLVEALFLPAPDRVLRRVADAAAMYGDGLIPLTQEEVAAMAGTTRPTVNRALAGAQRAGVLSVARGRIRVTDLAGLRRLC